MAERNPLTLSRQELYDLVWSKPVTEVAKAIGLSDVAIAKRCRQVQVPVPPRGYWAQVAAGQTPARAALPRYRDASASARRRNQASMMRMARQPSKAADVRESEMEPGNEPLVTFHVQRPPEDTAKAKDGTEITDPLQAELRAKLVALSVPADAPEDWVSLADRSVGPPGWPEELRSMPRLPPIQTHSKTSEMRARRLSTRLIQLVNYLGWRFVVKAPEPSSQTYYQRRWESQEEAAQRSAHFLVEDERLFIAITERQTRTERPLTSEEQRERRRNPSLFYYRDRYQYHPSGELNLHVSTSTGSGGFASFRDTKRSPLERRVSDILRTLLQGALDIKRRRQEAAEEAERERQEQARRDQLRRLREAHARFIAELEAQSGAWERARRLRRYLRAAREQLGTEERMEVSLDGHTVDLLAIGEAFANQLDPLHPAARGKEFFSRKDPYSTGHTYESDETKLAHFVGRWLGGDWRRAGKACEPAAPAAPPGALLIPDDD